MQIHRANLTDLHVQETSPYLGTPLDELQIFRSKKDNVQGTHVIADSAPFDAADHGFFSFLGNLEAQRNAAAPLTNDTRYKRFICSPFDQVKRPVSPVRFGESEYGNRFEKIGLPLGILTDKYIDRRLGIQV
jgi:hypothetical protein